MSYCRFPASSVCGPTVSRNHCCFEIKSGAFAQEDRIRDNSTKSFTREQRSSGSMEEVDDQIFHELEQKHLSLKREFDSVVTEKDILQGS